MTNTCEVWGRGGDVMNGHNENSAGIVSCTVVTGLDWFCVS